METGTSRPRRSPWIERGIFLAVIVALGLWLAYSALMGGPQTIVVDGKPVATLESRSQAMSVLDEVKQRQMQGRHAESPAFTPRVAIRRAPKGTAIDTVDGAVLTLDSMVVLKAPGYAIVVDGQPVTALPNEKDAYRALDLLKQRYSSRLKNIYALPVFKEEVIVDQRYLPVRNMLATPEDAVNYLTTVHEKPTYHTLKRGDRAVHITAQYGISLHELKELNPGMDMNRLTEGDRLLIRRPKPPVTVVVKALTTKVTAVKTPADRDIPARTGKRQTWAVVTYENGHEVGQQAIRVMTTWDKPAPKPTRTYRHYTSKRSTSSKTTSGTRTAPAQPAEPAQPSTP